MDSGRFQACALAVACATVMTTCADDRGAPGSGASGPLSVGIFPASTHTRVVEYPVEGVDLGQGWHREGVSKAIATCIEFVGREDTGQEQSMELSVVTDSSALMNKLDISAEAQFKSIGYSVSGKARFAKDTELRSNSVNVLAHAKVMNGIEYVAPAESGSQQGRIDLTAHYRDLARRDRVSFEQECGDGFVAAVHSGAELTAMLSFTASSSTERTNIEAAMSGSGWGFSAKGKASSVMQTAADNSALRVTFYQTGGSGSPIPTTQAGFVSAIERLPALAAADPYNYQIQVLDYRALPGYPGGSPEEHDEFRQILATSYGRAVTLRGAVVEALEGLEAWEAAEKSRKAGTAVAPTSLRIGAAVEPKSSNAVPSVDAHADQSPPAFRKRMQALHDDLMARLRDLRRIAEQCTFYDKDMGPQQKGEIQCMLPADLDLRNDYAYRLRLPVLRVPENINAEDIKAAIIDQHVRHVSRRRCERDLHDPGCLTERAVEELRKAL